MNCVKHKPKGRGGCQRGFFCQRSCRRKGIVKYSVRGAKVPTIVMLCKKCSETIGRTIGQKQEE